MRTGKIPCGRASKCGPRISLGQKLQRRCARLGAHHRVDERAVVAGVLGPVRLVDRGLVGVFGFGERDVAGELTGLNAPLRMPQHRLEPGAAAAPVGPHVQAVAIRTTQIDSYLKPSRLRRV